MEKIVRSTKETRKLAREIAKNLKPGQILALYGELGTGKTTFTRFLAKELGFEARVQSPTFVLARVYERQEGQLRKINHLDLYRLQNSEEVEELALQEYFYRPYSVTVIEWPEKAEKFLPEDTIKIYFEDLGENKRKIDVQNLY